MELKLNREVLKNLDEHFLDLDFPCVGIVGHMGHWGRWWGVLLSVNSLTFEVKCSQHCPREEGTIPNFFVHISTIK